MMASFTLDYAVTIYLDFRSVCGFWIQTLDFQLDLDCGFCGLLSLLLNSVTLCLD